MLKDIFKSGEISQVATKDIQVDFNLLTCLIKFLREGSGNYDSLKSWRFHNYAALFCNFLNYLSLGLIVT